MADHCLDDDGSFNDAEEAAGEKAAEAEEEQKEEVGEAGKAIIEQAQDADDAAVNDCSAGGGPDADCSDESLPTVDSTGEWSTARTSTSTATATTTLDEACTSARSAADEDGVELRRDSTTSLTSAGRRRRWQSIALDNYEPDYYSYNYELENDLLDLSCSTAALAATGTTEKHATSTSNATGAITSSSSSSFCSSSTHPPFSASVSSSSTTSTSSSSSFMAQVTSSNNANTSFWRKWEEDNASGVDATGAHNAEAKKQRLIDFDYDHFEDDLGDQVVDGQQFSPNRSQQLFLQTPFVDTDKFLESLDQAQIDFDQATSHNIINNSATLNFDSKMPQLQKLPVTGLRQSPIDIPSAATSQKTRQKRSVNEAEGGVAPLTIDYSPVTGASGLTLENTGHGWKLNIPDEVARKCPITGGPLGTDEYRLLQIHSHWGKDSQCGSEHTLNGQAFPCEVHLVHWNATKYANPLEAMECTNDGLAVVGVFVRLSQTASDPLNVIIKGLPKIAFRGNSIPVTETVELDLNQLVPSREVPKYFNYEGSLTTPPYSESVIWIVMEDPIDAQEEQISQFREMNKNDASAAEVAICKENYREVQSLNARNIAYFE